MKENIEKIIEDICTLAPELGEKKQEVRRLVEALIEHKPDITVDSAFVEELRKTLRSEMRVPYQPAKASSFNMMALIQGVLHNKIAYSFVALVLVVLATLPFVNISKRMQTPEDTKVLLAPQVKDLSQKAAFGSLADVQQTGDQTMVAAQPQPTGEIAKNTNVQNNAVSPSIRSASMPSMYAAGTNQDTTVSSGSASAGGAVSPSSVMIPPWGGYQYPVYIYKGELPDIDAEGYVYRREPGITSGNLNKLLGNLNLGLVNMGSFSGASIQRLEVVSKGEPSYNVSVDMTNGEVSIYRVETNGVTESPANAVNPSKIDDVSMVAIANVFLSEHGIDVSSYGAPQVQKPTYYYAMPLTENVVSERSVSSDYFMPYYNLTVLYPLVINGMRVVEQGGSQVGISVSINVQGKFVESVYGLRSQNYERSLYPFLQDKAKILEMVRNGGYGQNYYPLRESDGTMKTKTLSISVGDPEIVLMRYWKYEQNASQPTELLVPALMFDIDQESWSGKGIYVQDAITIPLVEELIQDQWSRSIPVPMPMMKGGAGVEGSAGGNSGSAGAGTSVTAPQPAALGN